MLAKARQILVSELALAEKTNEDKAEALLDEVLVMQPGQPGLSRAELCRIRYRGSASAWTYTR